MLQDAYTFIIMKDSAPNPTSAAARLYSICLEYAVPLGDISSDTVNALLCLHPGEVAEGLRAGAQELRAEGDRGWGGKEGRMRREAANVVREVRRGFGVVQGDLLTCVSPFVP